MVEDGSGGKREGEPGGGATVPRFRSIRISPFRCFPLDGGGAVDLA